MTGRPLAITQRQVEALAKGAAKANCRVEIKIGGAIVTVIPSQDASSKHEVDEWENVNI